MYKKLLFKKFSSGFHDASGNFVKTGRSWFTGGVLVHESEWSKYDFRINGKGIPELHTVDYSLKYRQDEIKRATALYALMPADLRADCEARYIKG